MIKYIKLKNWIINKYSRFLYLKFNYDTQIIVPYDFYENGIYVITEYRCSGCHIETYRHAHKIPKPSKYFSINRAILGNNKEPLKDIQLWKK